MRYSVKTFTVLLALCMSVCAGRRCPGSDCFVSVDGSDTNPGTKQQPFATVARARDAVRKRITSGLTSDVTVLIRKGTYRLPEPLVLGVEDSGTEQHAITYAAYPGETVVISGGRRISGWKQGESNVWTAKVPGVDKGRGGFRNLFVNGRRAVRARSPNRDAKPNCRQLKGVEWLPDRTRLALILPAGLVSDWQNPSDIEVMVAGNWAVNRKRVQSIDTKANAAVLAPPHRHGPAYIFPRPGRWCYFENARELLDQPGEWHLDRKTALLSCWPMPGEEMSAAEVIAPVLAQLVIVKGTPDRPVRNLHFKGLRFEHTDWQLPPDGYMGIQACHHGHDEHPGRRWKRIPAAVSFRHAEKCSLEDCVVARVSGSGVELADGCRGNLVRGNHIFDVSANGLMVGGPNSEAEAPRDNQLSNNLVHACGREYHGAIGIWVGFARGTTVSHNLVHDLPYTGISMGWQWNPQPTPCKENVVEYNHVHDVMNRLCDGGCIYTLGFQPGTIIRGNHLHAVHRSPMAQGAPNNGMFIDQGSKGYLFQENVIYDTHSAPIRFNQCQRDWHTWQDNHVGKEAKVKQAGKEIVEKAGLQSPWRERFAAERTDWFHEARWGVMTHYLGAPPSSSGGAELTAEMWNKRLDAFDVGGLTDQLASTGAKYLLLTIGQNSGHYCAPNATYDKIVGITPSKCSRRDLVADLAKALKGKDVRLMVYLPSGAPAADVVARKKLAWRWGRPGGWQLPGEPVGGRLVEFQRNWEAVIREWSLRWGKDVAGWWIDGCYFADKMYRFEDEPNFASLSAALRAGNPDAIVAFNPGVRAAVVAHTKHEDYAAGEVNLNQLPKAVASCPGRWLEREGTKVQFHILTFLGKTWCRGERPQWPDEKIIDCTRQIVEKGGVVTYDVPIQTSGLIPQPFIEQLRAVGRAMRVEGG